MKIVNAFWEKRNLGVTCAEITLEPVDTVDRLREAIIESDAEYIVVKINTHYTHLLFDLSLIGLSYVEDSVSLVKELHQTVLPSALQRLADLTAIRRCTDISAVLKQVRIGVFHTDRVSIDPCFSKEDAAARFVGWLRDEEQRGTFFYEYLYREQPVGFFTLRDTGEGEFDSVLGGLYPHAQKLPIGNVMNYMIFDEARLLGGKRVCTTVSTNNPVQFRSLLGCGYFIKEICHVYVMHRSNRSER